MDRARLVGRVAVAGGGVATVGAAGALTIALAVDADCRHEALDVAVAIWLGAAGAATVALIAVAYAWWLSRNRVLHLLTPALGLLVTGLMVWCVALLALAQLRFAC